MRVYQFDMQTRAYIGPLDLGPWDRNPRDPAEFLIPGNAVTIAPPETGPGDRVVWAGQCWAVEPAHAPADAPHAVLMRLHQARQFCDAVALDCFKRGLPYPAAWRDYDRAIAKMLRAPPPRVAEIPVPPAPPEFEEAAE